MSLYRVLITGLLLSLILIFVGCSGEADDESRAARIIESAEESFAAGDYASAEADFRLALALAGSDKDTAQRARSRLADATAERWYLEAYSMLNQLQMIDPPPPTHGSPRSMEELFQLLQLEFAQLNYQISIYPLLRSAVQAVNRGLDVRPDHPGLNYILALLYTQTGDPNLALRQLKRIRDVSPEHWAFDRGMAYLYRGAGEREKSLEAAARALELSSDPADRMLAYDLIIELSLDDPDPKLVDTYLAKALEEFAAYGDPEAMAMKIDVAKAARERRQPDYESLLERAKAALEKPFISEHSRESFVYSVASLYANNKLPDEAIKILENHVNEGGDFTIIMQQLIQQINMMRPAAELKPDFSIVEEPETEPAPETTDTEDEE